MNSNSLKIFLLAGLASSIMAGCSSQHDRREEFVDKLAFDSGFKNKVIESGQFLITTYGRIDNELAPVRVYVEGDGFAWRTRRTPSVDPTPKNPMGLKLAHLDDYPNVIYLARPCQYTKLADTKKVCDVKYWTSERFSREVLSTMFGVLDFYKHEYNLKEFELIGYSGGANIAGLLAAHRDDVVSLRTVAGNVDNDAFIQYHQVSEMPYSLDMADYAGNLRALPQVHYTGSEDKVIPAEILKSYESKIYDTRCFRARTLEANHHTGWEQYWKQIINSDVPYCE